MIPDMQKVADVLCIQYRTSGDKHCTAGWIQFTCPYCGRSGFYLGWNIDAGFFTCWACGPKKTLETLQKLSGKTIPQIRQTIARYPMPGTAKRVQRECLRSQAEYPWSTKRLDAKQRAYLKRRNFDPDVLEAKYELVGTSKYSSIGSRIVFPVYQYGVRISYMARAIGNEELRWVKCPNSKEGYPLRRSLFGVDFLRSKRIVVCEGILDQVRLGDGAVATFGLGFSGEQVRLLSEFEKVFIMFDMDKPGRMRSDVLASRLCSLTDVEILEFDAPDPGDLSQHDADLIMSELKIR